MGKYLHHNGVSLSNRTQISKKNHKSNLKMDSKRKYPLKNFPSYEKAEQDEVYPPTYKFPPKDSCGRYFSPQPHSRTLSSSWVFHGIFQRIKRQSGEHHGPQDHQTGERLQARPWSPGRYVDIRYFRAFFRTDFLGRGCLLFFDKLLILCTKNYSIISFKPIPISLLCVQAQII